MTKRFGQVIKLKKDGIKPYVKYHAKPWPEVNATLKKAKISNYSIFIRKDVLFAYFEYTGNNFDKDTGEIAKCAHTQKWWDLVKPLMQPYSDISHEEFWSTMEEVYHLD